MNPIYVCERLRTSMVLLFLISNRQISASALPATIPNEKMQSVRLGLNAVTKQPIVVSRPSTAIALRQLYLSMIMLDTGPNETRKKGYSRNN